MKKLLKSVLILFAATISFSTLAKNGIENAKITVSTKPLYNITAAVLGNLNTPNLILKNNSSPHSYSLKLSEVADINSADVIIWGGSRVDSFLGKLIDNVAKDDIKNKKNRLIIDISENGNINKLPIRDNSVKDISEEENSLEHLHAKIDINQKNIDVAYDPHIWLSLANAAIIADDIAHKLEIKYPDSKQVLESNLQDFKNKLIELEKQIASELINIKETGFLVFHDAYQYFENQFNLNNIGSIHLNPQATLSAKKLKILEDHVNKYKIRCMFSEPQFNSVALENLAINLDIKTGTLDPLGRNEDLGTEGYIKLIQNLKDSFKECLK